MQEWVQIYRGHRGWISSLAWSPDGTRIASASDDGTVHVWEVSSGKATVIYGRHNGSVNVLAWSPDGSSLASGGSDQRVQVWDATTGEQRLSYRGHSSWIRCGLAWSPDGSQLASGGWDRTVQVWDAHSGQTRLIYQGHAGIVSAVAWSPDGRSLASGGDAPDWRVQVWDASSGEHRLSYRGHCSRVQGVTWSLDGRSIVSVDRGSEAHVWDAATGNNLSRSYQLGKAPLVWSPDGKSIVSIDAGSAVLWDASSAKRLLAHPIEGDQAHGQQVTALGWSPDGALMAAGGSERSVNVWEVAAMVDVATEEAWASYLSHQPAAADGEDHAR